MKLLRILGFPMALIYGSVVRIRNYFYDTGLFKANRFDTPTICVGNLSLGGTGKTPMVEFLVSAFSKSKKVAVLSRGYKRKSTGFVLAGPDSTVEELGDEPFQIFKKFPRMNVAVDSDRTNGIKRLQSELKPDLIILDDAFQHRKINPTFSILLTSFDKLYSEDYFLPFGTLRDARSQARRAQVIVVSKSPQNMTDNERERIVSKLKPERHQKVLFASLEYNEILKGSNADITFELLSKNDFTLVTGIANPSPLVAYLKRKGLKFEHLCFKDHHSFTSREMGNLNSKAFILTTEKDYVRLQGKVKNLAYIEIAHKFLNGGEQVLINELEGVTKLNF